MRFLLVVLLFLLVPFFSSAQERTILVPKAEPGSPFKVTDTNDLFGQSYRWFIEGDYQRGVDSLKQLILQAGISLDKNAYYMLAANFTDKVTPIGILHSEDDFFSNRMYGLQENNLYYILITRQRKGNSFVSLMATAKESPFMENLPLFIGLFQPLPFATSEIVSEEGTTTYIDVRRYKVPRAFRKFSDLSIIVKTDLSSDKILAKTVFDNTAKERFSYGIATAITNISDVDMVVGNDGKITVRPKPGLDPAVFAVINYHFSPVDTKMPSFGNSFHLLAGLRLKSVLEPLIGIGGGVDLGAFGLHLFAGYSVEIAQELKNGFAIVDVVTNEKSPFNLKLRGKPRFGIEVKFP